MTDDLIHTVFSNPGALFGSARGGPQCPPDELIADYMSHALGASEKGALEQHALGCGPCHALLRALVDIVGLERPAPRVDRTPARLRLSARLAGHGLALLDALERRIASPVPAPALGALRRKEGEDASRLRITGPGSGLDELSLERLSDGTVRVQVSGRRPAGTAPAEILSVVLEVEGRAREKRPFDGTPVTLGPVGAGLHNVRLFARAPGEAARELASAEIHLSR
jgi:hypothetical protein